MWMAVGPRGPNGRAAARRVTAAVSSDIAPARLPSRQAAGETARDPATIHDRVQNSRVKASRIIIIIIVITTTMFMVLSSWPKSSREFTRFI